MMLMKNVIFPIVSLVILFCWATNALPSRPTSNPIGQGYIFGGGVVPIEEFPYQVALERDDGFSSCGGSIIGVRHVLTAAHCTINVDFVRAGSNTTSSGGILYDIIDVVRHENYSYLNYVNDIAILTVEPDIIFDRTRQPIELFKNREEVPVGQMGTISGYGLTNAQRVFDGPLKAVRVPMVSREFCNSVYEGWGRPPVLEDRICACTEVGGEGFCLGDSGGPLVINGQLVGIITYGLGCGLPDIPGVHVRVAYFYDWIVKNTRL